IRSVSPAWEHGALTLCEQPGKYSRRFRAAPGMEGSVDLGCSDQTWHQYILTEESRVAAALYSSAPAGGRNDATTMSGVGTHTAPQIVPPANAGGYKNPAAMRLLVRQIYRRHRH